MIAIASDHAGFALKEKLKLHFKENNIPLTDKKEIKKRIEEFINS